MAVALIHDRFSDRNNDMVGQAAAIADAMLDPKELRPWQIPSGPAKSFDKPAEAFNRDEIGNNYATAVASAGSKATAGDVTGLKLQSDWMAALERAYRARHASVPRLLVMSAGRRKGHGHAAGPIAAVARYALTVIAAGEQKPSPPQST